MITIIERQFRKGIAMAVLKYSRQRESIKEFLAHTKEHPTADTVYMNIRKIYPNISLGTVYRNLNLLTDLGDIIKISCGDGCDRFDGNVDPHYHFVCTHCNSVEDIYIGYMKELDETVNQLFDGQIESHKAIFYGKCSKCKTCN